MIYLIGGPPRVGKGQLLREVLKRHPMHAVATDAVRYMLRQSFANAIPPALLTQTEDILTDDPADVLTRQNDESRALWPALVQLMRSHVADGEDLLVEGVAVLPELAAALQLPHRVVILGNTSPHHAKTVLAGARANEHDWLHAYDGEQIAAYARFFSHMSRHLQADAGRYGLPYCAVTDEHFKADMARAAELLVVAG